ncbi:MAG: hypothetical protein KF689_00245 [Gemmatimonadaceae bacterium]|nr:hypothetical protein [Gemmatimonadaceae bacterium]MCW5826356.1 hypothetical protein [Gemmatimonadaceae bacterium]
MTQIYDDDRRLDAAVSLGIISAEQAAAIRGLTPQRSAPALPQPVGAPTIGYVLGAITVLVAMGWFLADRWEWLGAGGVLAVVVLYAALFVAVGGRLRREGFSTASGFAVLLAVAMVPIAVVALNELLQWFPATPAAGCRVQPMNVTADFSFWGCRGLEVTIELTTLLAALVGLRATRFPLLAAPIAALLLRGVFLVADGVLRGEVGRLSAAWVWAAGASLLVAGAYVLDRRQPEDEDYALWFHLVAAFAGVIATAILLNSFEQFRHLLVPAAFVAFTFSLRMRRFVWTLVGLGWFVTYLGWLAADVFKDTPFFPIVLAALGLGVIIATVWVQRNSAMLVARFGGLGGDARPAFPGGVGLLLLPALVAALQLPAARFADRELRRESAASMRMYGAMRARRDAEVRRARREATGQAVPSRRPETPPPRLP